MLVLRNSNLTSVYSYPSCPHSVAALFIIVYVDNNALRYNCDELVEQFEASIAADARIQLHRDGNLEWVFIC